MQKIHFNLPKFELEKLAKIALEAMEEEYSNRVFGNSNYDIGTFNNVKKQKQNEQKQRLQHA